MLELNPRRNKAALIDLWIVMMLFVVPFFLIDKIPPSISGKLTVIGVALSALYGTFRDAINGQSIGKRIYKIQVIRTSTKKPIGFFFTFIRGFVTCLPVVGQIDFIKTMLTPNDQRMSDNFLGLQLIMTDQDGRNELLEETKLDRTKYNTGDPVVCPTCEYEFRYMDATLHWLCDRCGRELWK